MPAGQAPQGYGQQPQGLGQAPTFGAPQAYGAAGPYNPQGAYGGGYRPPGAYGQGFQGAPAPKAGSSSKILIIVVAAVVVLGLLGGAVALLSNKPGGTTPSVVQATPTRGTTTSAPSTSTKAPSTTTPTKGTTTTAPAGGAIAMANGLAVTPADGWTLKDQDGTTVSLTNGSAFYYAIAVSGVPGGTAGTAVVDKYLANLSAKLTNVSKDTTDAIEVDPKVLAAEGGLQGTLASSSGSQKVGVAVVGSVRQSDGVTFIGVLLYDAAASTADLKQPFTDMTVSILKTQVA
jgi:cytoskeletal protein RodZ